MSTETPNRIAELRKQKRMTQQQLAEAVGAHWITISKLERGKIALTYEWAARIGKALGVGEFDIYKNKITRRNIFVSGYVQNGGIGYFYSTAEGKRYEHPLDIEIDLFTRAETSWFVIEDDAGFPFFQTGDVVQVTWQDNDAADDFISRMCLVGAKDRSGLILGFLSRGKNIGTYDVNVVGGSVVKDIIIEELGFISMALFNAAVFDEGGPVAPEWVPDS
ncbi:helix-turn-helix transcriptional regulator [Methylobacterium platani]|uniref:HTH cro/C1-type domain-containing protein n=1 Tax=Methylobacterium platani JCM 14648 TaxID=1295136 RepID=A0ABR5H804_9HYPH|nr:helix-turn-helix transcriptional regulator [Methylobacterium platani]KMO20635.1 hypothetical protein SQ03_05235 [Methylobacterium platani JCM 14648]